VYAAEVALAGTFLYVRHLLLGAAFGPEVEKAFAVVAATYLLFAINVAATRVGGTTAVFVRPTFHTALALPLALFAVTPFDQRAGASLVLFAAASFYLVVARAAGTRNALLPGAALMNAAVYLWVPVAHAGTGLLELYVIPAALTVLVFAHLHRDQLGGPALTTVRLAASAAILATSTYGVFVQPSLMQFVAMLGASLAVIAGGIALRVRPFVYIGLGFLIVNVVGQVGVQVHAQGGIARAVILITVGIAVMSLMVFFNAQREEILRRYRLFVADARWE
jgi:hypothetical protein